MESGAPGNARHRSGAGPGRHRRPARRLGADPLRLLDGRRPRRQPQRHRHRHPRSVTAGALDGRRSLPARRGEPARRPVHAPRQRRAAGAHRPQPRTLPGGAARRARPPENHPPAHGGAGGRAPGARGRRLHRRPPTARRAVIAGPLPARGGPGRDRGRRAQGHAAAPQLFRHHAAVPGRPSGIHPPHRRPGRHHPLPGPGRLRRMGRGPETTLSARRTGEPPAAGGRGLLPQRPVRRRRPRSAGNLPGDRRAGPGRVGRLCYLHGQDLLRRAGGDAAAEDRRRAPADARGAAV